MRHIQVAFFVLTLVTFYSTTFAVEPELPKKIRPSSIRVEFPIGDLRIRYLESDERMVLDMYIDGKEASLRTRSVFISDGKIGVRFAATDNGFFTPTGKVNAAYLDFKNGATIEYIPGRESKWGARNGEVYLLVPNIKLKPRE